MGNIIELEKEFISYSEQGAVFLEKADSKNANKIFAKLTQVIKDIKSLGDSGIELLRKLMVHDNTWIAVHAASALREELPDEAKKILQKIANHSLGMPSTIAYTTLKLWEHGIL